jgi:hypothetical protein
VGRGTDTGTSDKTPIAATGGNKATIDIYNNSSGHNRMAKDALNVDKLNIGWLVKIK